MKKETIINKWKETCGNCGHKRIEHRTDKERCIHKSRRDCKATMQCTCKKFKPTGKYKWSREEGEKDK